MAQSQELNTMFFALLALVILSGILTGSTWQWVHHHGGFRPNGSSIMNNNPTNTQYHALVTIAAGSSLIQCFSCYVNYLMSPDHNLGFMVFILVNWVVMTHSSVLLVARKLSFCYQNAQQVWRRLLLINVFMMPLSIFICIYWAWTYNREANGDMFKTINRIVEPIQITLWGLIEFCLSGAFIVKMWKFHWTTVERQAIFVLILVACCDVASVLSNIFIGDLESTCVKGFVYALRIRLEVSVLCEMVEFVKNRRGRVTFGSSTTANHTMRMMVGGGRHHLESNPTRSSWTPGSSWLFGSVFHSQHAVTARSHRKTTTTHSHSDDKEGQYVVESGDDGDDIYVVDDDDDSMKEKSNDNDDDKADSIQNNINDSESHFLEIINDDNDAVEDTERTTAVENLSPPTTMMTEQDDSSSPIDEPPV